MQGPEASVPLCCMKTILWGQLKSAVRCREETGSPKRREEEGRRGKGLGGGRQAGQGWHWKQGKRRETERKQALLVVGWWLD